MKGPPSRPPRVPSATRRVRVWRLISQDGEQRGRILQNLGQKKELKETYKHRNRELEGWGCLKKKNKKKNWGEDICEVYFCVSFFNLQRFWTV